MPGARGLAIIGVVAGAMAAAAKPPAPQPGFWLMGLQPDGKDGQVRGLNYDGSMAAGTNTLTASSPGFTWTKSGGRFDFGLLPGMPIGTPATGLSDNGIVVGATAFGNAVRPYRWTGSGPLQDLGVLPRETRSFAHGVAGDGTVVVGHAEHGDWTFYTGQAFRWTAAKGMQGLGYAKPWDGLSVAYGVSRDGSTIVGFSGPIGTDAFAWTEAGGMKILPKLPNPVGYDSSARAVNLDGSVIVGDSPSADGYGHAVRWVNGQARDLAQTFGSVNSVALAVSDDGSVVAGTYSTSTSFGFVWSDSTGMLNADAYLAQHGVTVPTGYWIEYVFAISGDGLTIGGVARNFATNKTEGFVATVPEKSCAADCDGSGGLDIDDFICFQTYFALGEQKADCDSSGALDIDDFICFQTFFAVGC